MKKINLIYTSAFVVFAAGLFTIPYLFPPKQISISASYDYGFNNRAGMLLLAFFSMLIILYSFIKGKTKHDQVAVFFDNIVNKPNKLFLIISGITIIGCCVLWIILGRDSYGLGESGYFIPHIYDITFGKTIYKDFQFNYGPILLYFPYFIYRILSFLSFSVSDGYMIALILNQLSGLYFLHYILSSMNFSSKERNVIFIIIAIISFPLSTGLNYTLFRFMLPHFCFVFLRQIQKKSDTKPVFYIVLSVLFSVLALFTSPELGIGFCFTLIIYLAVSCFFSKKKIYLLQISLLLCTYFLVVYFFPGLFYGLFGFSSGGMNWPFVPSLVLAIFFLAVFIVSMGIGVQLRSIGSQSYNLSFILLSFSFIPGALGRCDPGHIFWYGIFILLLAYKFIRLVSEKIKIFSGIILIFTFLSLYPFWIKEYVPLYGYSVFRNMGQLDNLPSWVISLGKIWGIDDIEEKVKNRRERGVLDYEEIFSDIDDVTMPLGGGFDIYLFLNKSNKYIPLYYRVYLDGSKYSVDRNLAELSERQPQYILVYKDWNKMSEPADQSIINVLFCTYYPAKPGRNGNAVFEPLLDYIDTNYVYTRNVGDHFLLKRKNMGEN